MNNKQMQLGFTLMEMMVALLIVAIVAAASAPMIKYKFAQNMRSSSSSQVLVNNDKQSEIAELKAQLIIYEKQLHEFERRLHKIEMWSSKE